MVRPNYDNGIASFWALNYLLQKVMDHVVVSFGVEMLATECEGVIVGSHCIQKCKFGFIAILCPHLREQSKRNSWHRQAYGAIDAGFVVALDCPKCTRIIGDVVSSCIPRCQSAMCTMDHDVSFHLEKISLSHIRRIHARILEAKFFTKQSNVAVSACHVEYQRRFAGGGHISFRMTPRRCEAEGLVMAEAEFNFCGIVAHF